MSESIEHDFQQILQDFQTGLIRKPEQFNLLHFLLLLFYDSHGSPRDDYPLWRWYHRIKKKYILVKNVKIEIELVRQSIIAQLQTLIETNLNVHSMVAEAVRIDGNSPIHGLFRFYTPIHTFIYLQQMSQPESTTIFEFFQSNIIKSHRSKSSDFIHFAIVHRKTKLLERIFQSDSAWIESSIDLVTDRGWLPLHYAAYVADTETVSRFSRECSSLCI